MAGFGEQPVCAGERTFNKVPQEFGQKPPLVPPQNDPGEGRAQPSTLEQFQITPGTEELQGNGMIVWNRAIKWQMNFPAHNRRVMNMKSFSPIRTRAAAPYQQLLGFNEISETLPSPFEGLLSMISKSPKKASGILRTLGSRKENKRGNVLFSLHLLSLSSDRSTPQNEEIVGESITLIQGLG